MKRLLICALTLMFALMAMAQELNVASVNVRCNAKNDYKKHNGWNDRKGYLCDMINHEAFDVFGAQEVTKVQLDDMLKGLPDYNYIGVAREDGKEKGEFSPVFYRKKEFKLLDSGTFWLSPTPDVPSKGWDAKYNRVCSWGLFRRKATGEKFYFLNVHFDHRGVQARIEAAKQLVAYVKEYCKGVPVIISGDFNVTQNSDAYKVLATSKILKDSYDVAKYRFAPTGTFNGFNPNRYTTWRIDHLFVSKGVKVSRYGVLTYHYFRDINGVEQAMETSAPKEIKGENREIKCISDHYAIQAWVTLK